MNHVKPPSILELEKGEITSAGDGIRLKLLGITFEQIEPGPSPSYPAGSGATARIEAADDFGRQATLPLSYLSDPYHGERIAFFQGYRIRWVDLGATSNNPSLKVEVKKLEEGDWQDLGSTEWKLAEPVKLPGDLVVTFLAHGHKRTEVDGPPSPLLVQLRYEQSGRETVEASERLETEEGRHTWFWREYRFVLADHAYGEWMRVRAYRASEPVRHDPTP